MMILAQTVAGAYLKLPLSYARTATARSTFKPLLRFQLFAGSANLVAYQVNVTDCSWPAGDGLVRIYNPLNDFSHGCGNPWNQHQG